MFGQAVRALLEVSSHLLAILYLRPWSQLYRRHCTTHETVLTSTRQFAQCVLQVLSESALFNIKVKCVDKMH